MAIWLTFNVQQSDHVIDALAQHALAVHPTLHRLQDSIFTFNVLLGRHQHTLDTSFMLPIFKVSKLC